MQQGITVGEWKEKYKTRCARNDLEISNYGGYAYDAVWTYAYALDKLFEQNQSFTADLHTDAATEWVFFKITPNKQHIKFWFLRSYVKILRETDFIGVSGHIKFIDGPSRVSVISVVQWFNNSTNIVGSFYPNVSESKGEIIGGRYKATKTFA